MASFVRSWTKRATRDVGNGSTRRIFGTRSKWWSKLTISVRPRCSISTTRHLFVRPPRALLSLLGDRVLRFLPLGLG